MAPQLSIVMPVRNEAPLIAACLARLMALACPGGMEIIVVDGDSNGGTIGAIPEAFLQGGPHRVRATIAAQPGRGFQMNHGARLARGNCLLFLHADTTISQAALALIPATLQRSDVRAAAFDLAIDSKRRIFRLIERVANWRSRLTRIPYGDQAIFIDKYVFEQLGGYAPIPIMEDVEIMGRIKAKGWPICILPIPVTTSARRWQGEGVLACTLRNWFLITAYHLGANPRRLARFYR